VIPKSVQIAWNLIHILPNDYTKVLSLVFELNRRWQLNATEDYVHKIVAHMGHGGFLTVKKGCGIRRSRKDKIYLIDLMRHFDVKYELSTNHPAGRACLDVYKGFERIYFDNTKDWEIKEDGVL
jgi:hypothetical protein